MLLQIALGALIFAVLAALSYRRLRRVRKGLVPRIVEELNLDHSVAANGTDVLTGTFDGFDLWMDLSPAQAAKITFTYAEGLFPPHLRLRRENRTTSEGQFQLSFDGAVFVGPEADGRARASDAVLEDIDLVGRYWAFDHKRTSLSLQPRLDGVLEDLEWLVKTLRRVTALLKAMQSHTEPPVTS